ncbi:MAG: hypothetical protein ACRCTD_07025 [Beijerinckiaceae bacterium]
MRSLVIPAIMLVACIVARPVAAQTPAEAYAQGCGMCHTSERQVIRKIPRLPVQARQDWLVNFMANHPCERQNLKPQIVEYLMQKTAR